MLRNAVKRGGGGGYVRNDLVSSGVARERGSDVVIKAILPLVVIEPRR